MNDFLEKYSELTLNNLNSENINKIIDFLNQEKCDFIKDILEDYLDICTIDYEKFIEKYKKLNLKYNNEYLKLAANDMNLLEELLVD